MAIEKLDLDYFKKKFNETKNDKYLTDLEKHTDMVFLLSEMAYRFSIPLFYGEQYKTKNKDIIDVFESINNETTKLNQKMQID